MKSFRLSPHFQNTEFACKCGCGFGTRPGDVDDGLISVLEEIRTFFNAPVHITSGCRCEHHNRRVGGAPASKHLTGIAADITVKGITPRAVADYIAENYPDTFGVGRYRQWTHIDVRESKARWGSNL